MTNFDPWGPISATLYGIGSSDLVESIVRHTGVQVAWPTLDKRSGYSNKTRIRAYTPAIEAAYSQLPPDYRIRFLQAVVAGLLRSGIPDAVKDQMIDSLSRIGWTVTGDGTLAPSNLLANGPAEVQEHERIDAGIQTSSKEHDEASARSELAGSEHPKAFVSHSTQDRPFVEKFAADLRANGVDAWYSGWEIKPGDSIRAKIEEGLQGCEFFIVVLSRNSIARPWVRTELDAATIRKLNGKVRKIIPIKIEDCGDLPPTLNALCWEDFSGQPYEAAFKRVLNSIFGLDVKPPLGKPPSAPIPDEEAPPKQQFQITTIPATKFPIHMNDLGALAEQLRSEGFDARTDLFNGQVGLIVGPKSLDPKRMPPDLEGLFFPLWELNYDSNRPLVAARQFHDIFENRPSDWQFNRPYQRRAEQEPKMTRHWSRSASLLRDRNLEESIQQELTRRFPENAFPVNIDVVGAQDCTYAVVQINSSEAGIDETPRAIPEDFTGTGGMLAAVLSVVERVLSELQDTGRLSTANQRENDKTVHFPSKCPNCGNPTSHTFRVGELKNLLESDELKLSCFWCDRQWKPGRQETLNLAKWLDGAPTGQ